ncbi:hypothetical protein MLD38_039150 [Melastoma candidum]|uniref:Uncharacterized protein n=1 Tax=Melastoma candidum TaxID=119954 RepID=A0ACB9L1H1_9MYRT|nr:hypothetical protein MLD38_039150 [Melastoma candidum]
MELEDKKEAETAPRVPSLEGGDKKEADPKPAEASTVQRDEKEDSSPLFNTSGESVSMALEDQGNPKVPADAIVPSLAAEQESKDEGNAYPGRDIKSLSAQAEEKAEEMIKPSTLSNSVDEEKIDAKTFAEASNKLPASKNKAAAFLKARGMITKKFPVTSSFKKNAKPGDSKVLRSKVIKKKGLTSTDDGVTKEEQDIKESTSEDKTLPGDLSKVKATEEEDPSIRHKGKQGDGDSKDFHERIKSKNKQNFGSASKNKKRKLGGRENLQSSEKAENSRKKGQTNDTEENRKENRCKKEKLGGLIFMCSSKTKPDCIKYRVMGVNMGKKDLVMAIQPGLKLFLYDYDLKLMYGIFKASSGGGIKLEPRAFNGAFPVQVRFDIQVQCYPLPDVIFKKAMLDNFTSKHKFRTELSHKQVRKLSELFQPVALVVYPPTQVAELPDRSSRRKRTREGNSQARKRVPRHRPRTKKSSRDSFDDSEARRLDVRVYERDHRDLSTLRRVDAPRESFLTEREYRDYGLQGERRNLAITANVDPHLLSREAYYEDHLSRRANEIQRDTVTGHRAYVLASRRYLDDIDYRTYSHDTRPERSPATAGRSIGSTHYFYPEDQYITYRHGPASLVPYAERLRREDIPLSSLHGYDRAQAYGYETDRVQRMEDVPIGSRSIVYVADASEEYDRAIRYRIPPADACHTPASSRCSFAGPRI